eukprot:gene11277-23590_t
MSEGNVDSAWDAMKKADAEALANFKTRVKDPSGKLQLSSSSTNDAKNNKNKAKKLSNSSIRADELKMVLVGQLGGESLPSTSKSGQINLTRKSSKSKSNKHVVPPQVNYEVESSVVLEEKIAFVQVQIDAQEMILKIGRDINLINSEKDMERRRGLASLQRTLFIEHKMNPNDYSEVFRDICKTIFKRYSDSIEKCRELALTITQNFFKVISDMVPILPYFMPAIMQRLPPGLGYDEEMKVFIHDIEAHEEYRRGKAVDRQDKDGITSIQIHKIIETSEEIRLLLCQTLAILVKRIDSLGASTVLHPYFQEIVIYSQAQLRDPFPELKVEACILIQHLAEQEPYVTGMKYFAVALVRAVLPVLRHRHAKVRVAAVSSLKSCIMIPDRDKRKGAGTEAIQDLVGFREDNVLPVAGFYKTDVQVNYLAEIVQDTSIQVRERVVDMLMTLLTVLEDRYDHQTRLLPYLLDLLTDDVCSISDVALHCLKVCGKLYEDEYAHADDIIEKRQYGVDGDLRINLDKPLPRPFTERPRIGIRLYVRGNTARFLKALMNELTNWTSHTRIKSAQLLKIVIVLCEEHLTMEAYNFLPTLVKAVNFAKDDIDEDLYTHLMEICELTGRYMIPDTFIHYILPRLRGDIDILQYNADAKYRICVLEIMRNMLEGVKPTLIPSHFNEIITVVTDPFIIDPESAPLREAALAVIYTLLQSLVMVCRKKGYIGMETDNFQSTGRLMTSLQPSLYSCFKFLVEVLSHVQLQQCATSSLLLLAEIDKGRITDGKVSDGSVKTLFQRFGNQLLIQSLDTFDIDENCSSSSSGSNCSNNAEMRIMKRLVECPWGIILQYPETLSKICESLCIFIKQSTNIKNYENDFLIQLADILLEILLKIKNSTLVNTNNSNSNNSNKNIPVAYQLFMKEHPELLNPIPELSNISHCQKMREVLQSQMKNLIESFILDDRWNRISILQRKRMQVLNVLLAVDNVSEQWIMSPSMSMSMSGNDDDSKQLEQQQLKDEEEEEVVTAILANSFVFFPLFSTTISHRILSGCITDTLLPVIPEDIRLIAISNARHLCESTLTIGVDPISSSSALLARKLVPFSKRTQSQTQTQNVSISNSELNNNNDNDNDVDRSVFAMSVIEIMFRSLDDASDSVRLEAVRTLQHTLPYLPPDNSNYDISTTSTSSITFSSFIRRLLKELVITLVSEEFLAEVDSVLHAVAVLDPKLCKGLLRDSLILLEGVHKAPSVASDLFSGLLDHCELLESF